MMDQFQKMRLKPVTRSVASETDCSEQTNDQYCNLVCKCQNYTQCSYDTYYPGDLMLKFFHVQP